jgi:hypothetical protein
MRCFEEKATKQINSQTASSQQQQVKLDRVKRKNAVMIPFSSTPSFVVRKKKAIIKRVE